MSNDVPNVRSPGAVESLFNKLYGFFVGLGLGFSYNYLLQVQGRRSGRLYSTPVNVLVLDGKRLLVAPRGYTQWVRNAVATGSVVLKKGRRSEEFGLRPIPDEEKPEILRAYLDSYKTTVQRYFPIPAGSPAEHFRTLADRYPVFELMPR
jgi:deazaflavin-dependent oxidoreductase (nitroreductase family)